MSNMYCVLPTFTLNIMKCINIKRMKSVNIGYKGYYQFQV